MSKIVEGLREALGFSRCSHKFKYLREHKFSNGVVGYCPTCKCRVTAWPGTHHYNEILAAKGREG